MPSAHRRWLSKARWPWALAWTAFLALIVFNRGMRRLVAHRLELARLQKGIKALESEESDLRSGIISVSKDARALERAARRELGYVRPGEIEYRFPPPPKEPAR